MLLLLTPSWLICYRGCSLNRLARCQTLAKATAICNGNRRYKCENMPQFLQRFEFHLQAWRALLEIKQEMSEHSDTKRVGVSVVLLKLKFYTDPGEACKYICWGWTSKRGRYSQFTSCNLHVTEFFLIFFFYRFFSPLFSFFFTVNNQIISNVLPSERHIKHFLISFLLGLQWWKLAKL